MNDSLETTPFSEVLKTLQDANSPFPARYLRSFSDLSPRNLKDLLTIWEKLPEIRKVNLLEDLEDVLETDTIVNFDDLARELLRDSHGSIRALALNLLWECEEPNLIPELLNLATEDQDLDVRSASTSLLGKYALLGELDALKAEVKENVINKLMAIVQGADNARVKQRALEALGYSSHPAVPGMIQNAFLSTDPAWITSALCAMGRSADDGWASQVDAMLTSAVPEIQFEAVRAAGELELTSSRDKLFALLDAGLDDSETRLALIWSLSQIGGDDVKEKLDQLLENATEAEELEWIEKAIDNLELSSPGSLDAFKFDQDDDDDLDFEDDELLEDDDLDEFDDDYEDEEE